jgi:hypothetical protein
MFLEIFLTLLSIACTWLVAVTIVHVIHLRNENKRLTNAKRISSTVCMSASSDAENDTVEKLRFPYISLPTDAKLCPSSRYDDNTANTIADYFVQCQDRINLRLKANICVTYNGVEFIVVGNKSRNPNQMSDFEPQFKTSNAYNENTFEIELDEGTKVVIHENLDSTGLIKRLQARQSFHMLPGSMICLPAGTEVYMRSDNSFNKLVTEETFACTLHPPLSDNFQIPVAVPKIKTKKGN